MAKSNKKPSLTLEEKQIITDTLNKYKTSFSESPKGPAYKALRKLIHSYRDKNTWAIFTKNLLDKIRKNQSTLKDAVQTMIDTPKKNKHEKAIVVLPTINEEPEAKTAHPSHQDQSSIMMPTETPEPRSPFKWAFGMMLIAAALVVPVATATVSVMTILAAGLATYLFVRRINNMGDVFSNTSMTPSASPSSDAGGVIRALHINRNSSNSNSNSNSNNRCQKQLSRKLRFKSFFFTGPKGPVSHAMHSL